MSQVAGGVRPVAIVTGANHGIGAATAVALARAGCAVLGSPDEAALIAGNGITLR